LQLGQGAGEVGVGAGEVGFQGAGDAVGGEVGCAGGLAEGDAEQAVVPFCVGAVERDGVGGLRVRGVRRGGEEQRDDGGEECAAN